jgi:hypothetical protein
MSAWRQHKADIPHRMSDFRFRGESGHQNRGSRLPLMTRSGLQPHSPHERHGVLSLRDVWSGI